ncbi:hypothetical protein HPB50_015759 [Hyalomma asiaticum]|uniref:Uncharacterized protein n=1 Tax=Hyalomma asiaticum TaxID=266040 RepID=A0ACB7SWX6_HYAAI|nr:hypothetical protein HPB50_015759 [Hyalomma asiaticum]
MCQAICRLNESIVTHLRDVTGEHLAPGRSSRDRARRSTAAHPPRIIKEAPYGVDGPLYYTLPTRGPARQGLQGEEDDRRVCEHPKKPSRHRSKEETAEALAFVSEERAVADVIDQLQSVAGSADGLPPRARTATCVRGAVTSSPRSATTCQDGLLHVQL